MSPSNELCANILIETKECDVIDEIVLCSSVYDVFEEGLGRKGPF